MSFKVQNTQNTIKRKKMIIILFHKIRIGGKGNYSMEERAKIGDLKTSWGNGIKRIGKDTQLMT